MSEVGTPEAEASKRPNALVRGFQKFIGTYEETPGEILTRNQKDALALARELEKQKGEKALILTLGGRSSHFGTDATDRSYYGVPFHYEIWSTQNGEDLIGLYEQFRRIAPNERVAISVSEFKPRKGSNLNTISDVVRKVVELSGANGWTPPKIVGVPVEKQNFNPLKEAFPDIYLGDYTYEGSSYELLHKKFFEAIEQNLPPSSVTLPRSKSFLPTREEMEAEMLKEKQEKEKRLDEYERSIQPQMKKKAEDALTELRGKSGRRGFIIIIDDTPDKINKVQEDLIVHASETGMKYVIRGVTQGSDGIVLYEEFARLAPSEKVIIFMDGFLTGILDRGKDVTDRLVIKLKQKSLKMPFIVGESSNDKMNQEISDVNPNVYLGNFAWEDKQTTLHNIDSKL